MSASAGMAGEIVLGPFEVVADAASIASFAAAACAPAAPPPAAFPVVWLSEPALRAALRDAVGPDSLPVHESQSFDYAAPLVAGARYALAVRARREASPSRLVVECEAADAAGARTLAMRAVLRLVPLAGRPEA